MKNMSDWIVVHVWMRPLRDTREHWFMFFHQLDAKGQIVDNYEIPLSQQKSPHPDRPILLASTVFTLQDPKVVHSVAFGIRSRTRLLTADKGLRDWNDRRVIVSMTAVVR